MRYELKILFLALTTFFNTTCLAETLTVFTSNELKRAVTLSNSSNSNKAIKILIADGDYYGLSNLKITRPNVHISSASGIRENVVLHGNGMKKQRLSEVIFDISASNVSISSITLTDSPNHLIQVRAELGVSHFVLKNCVLRDSFEQLLKVSASEEKKYSDQGIIENNLFYYSDGVGPQYYIGGIDSNNARGWTVKKNHFTGIASPALREAQFAIHFWRLSSNNNVVDNVIVNSDRGIGLGMGNARPVQSGGTISNNIILHFDKSHLFSDVGIALENVKSVNVLNNLILSVNHYPNAIEFRYEASTDITIKGNKSNKAISARDGAQAVIQNNETASMFSTLWSNAMHLYTKLTVYIKKS